MFHAVERWDSGGILYNKEETGLGLRAMGWKRMLAELTMDKRGLQKKSIQMKQAFDEVQKALGDGKGGRKPSGRTGKRGG